MNAEQNEAALQLMLSIASMKRDKCEVIGLRSYLPLAVPFNDVIDYLDREIAVNVEQLERLGRV